ncbi:siphovirus Gp157 family protein [Enterococcus faecium]|uniref:siphovirus Gp157 family protein n=1 Tax=Enterococcus faecium TaxID=1352 RepID=UPI0034E97C0E
MATLYQLSESYIKVLELAEQLDEEILRDTLDSINEAIEDKAKNLAKIVKEVEGKAELIDSEIKRLKKRKTSLLNNAKSIEQYLKGEMEKTGKTKIKGELFDIRIQNNPVSVNVYNENLIPKEFFTPVPPKLDKKQLKEELKHGDIPGAELVQTKGLRIR